MGILDEAIREHLALKRRQGLSEDELKRLEDEAFGPPTRPGEPDFPDRDADGGPEGSAERAPERGEASAGTAAAERPDTAAEEVTDREPEEAEEAPADREPESIESGAEPSTPADRSPTDAGGQAAVEPSEAATAFHDFSRELDEAAGAAEEPQAAEEPPADASPAAEPAPEASPAAPAEEPPSAELDLGGIDLDLGEDDESPAAADRPEALEETGDPPPISSQETVEHPMHEELGEPPSDEHALEQEAPSEENALEEPPSDEYAYEPESDEYETAEPASDEHELEARESSEGADDDDDEDVLEETPEFLRDAPEDDELWFEQGEPKDFDF